MGEEEVGPGRQQEFLQALHLLMASSAISPAQARKNVAHIGETEIEAQISPLDILPHDQRIDHVTSLCLIRLE